jgi:hypothetical protein
MAADADAFAAPFARVRARDLGLEEEPADG